MGANEIIGIIIVVISILLAVFNNNKAKGSQTTPQSDATDSRQQIREIINRQARHIQQPKQRKATNKTASQSNKQEVLRNTIAANKQSNQAASTSGDSKSNPDNKSGKNQIEEITEDFTIEKAVIYSEILNPKFKEY